MYTAARKKRQMNKHNKKLDGKKASADTMTMNIGTMLLGLFIIVVFLLAVFTDVFGLSKQTKNTELAKGFDDLITKANMLAESGSNLVQVTHVFSVDAGYYVFSFDRDSQITRTTTKPPECEDSACFCVCIDEQCEKTDTKKNSGRDCRPLENYEKIIVDSATTNNECGTHFCINGANGLLWWHVGVERRVSITLKKEGENLMISQGP
jgi:hypothetical protein